MSELYDDDDDYDYELIKKIDSENFKIFMVIIGILLVLILMGITTISGVNSLNELSESLNMDIKTYFEFENKKKDILKLNPNMILFNKVEMYSGLFFTGFTLFLCIMLYLIYKCYEYITGDDEIIVSQNSLYSTYETTADTIYGGSINRSRSRSRYGKKIKR